MPLWDKEIADVVERADPETNPLIPGSPLNDGLPEDVDPAKNPLIPGSPLVEGLPEDSDPRYNPLIPR